MLGQSVILFVSCGSHFLKLSFQDDDWAALRGGLSTAGSCEEGHRQGWRVPEKAWSPQTGLQEVVRLERLWAFGSGFRRDAVG